MACLRAKSWIIWTYMYMYAEYLGLQFGLDVKKPDFVACEQHPRSLIGTFICFVCLI